MSLEQQRYVVLVHTGTGTSWAAQSLLVLCQHGNTAQKSPAVPAVVLTWRHGKHSLLQWSKDLRRVDFRTMNRFFLKAGVVNRLLEVIYKGGLERKISDCKAFQVSGKTTVSKNAWSKLEKPPVTPIYTGICNSAKKQRIIHVPLLAWKEGLPPSSLGSSSWWFWRKDELWYSQWHQAFLLDLFQIAARQDNQWCLPCAKKVGGTGRSNGCAAEAKLLTVNRHDY